MAEIVNKRPSLKPAANHDAERAAKTSAKPSQMAESQYPAEGPHARAHLINEDATPGAGLFSGTRSGNLDVDPGAG